MSFRTWCKFLSGNFLKVTKKPLQVDYRTMSVVHLDEIPPWNLSSEGRKAQTKYPASDLGLRVSLWSGDITKLQLDAIANAANARLAGGGGVDGAIHRAAGPDLSRACLELKGCPTGSAKITRGFQLPAKYIIHCVGPIGEKPDLLQSTYQRALELCTENQLQTIAFPCISTGVYGYPPDAAACVAIPTVLSYLSTHPDIKMVVFCVFLPEDRAIYERRLPEFLSR
ncbi:hypothetical protein P879_04922 [Paragonimus westermani]|uniref:Macro domain-containing protein n=1 Tax=Paragonimus westermani TaxID=34504 RepID=A0A8T0DP42_9TREM|nr:hypothetical protein P879_04922 [Paragonimus westermani]